MFLINWLIRRLVLVVSNKGKATSQQANCSKPKDVLFIAVHEKEKCKSWFCIFTYETTNNQLCR